MEVLLFALFFIVSLIFFIAGKDDFGRKEKRLIIKDIKEEFFVEEGIVEFANNNLLILSSTAKNISEIDKGSIEAHITDAKKRMEESKVTDKEKYLLSYKINTLKNLNL